MKISHKILLSTLGLPVVASPAFAMSSCSQTWGYLNPISFGSMSFTDQSNPYYNFRSSRRTDADGVELSSYLQSNYIIDQSHSSMYAFSSPASKWYDKETDPEQQVPLAPSNWERLADGWKTSASSDFESTVVLKQKEDGKTIRKSYANNMNMTLANNINFTGSIALTLSKYLSSALQYQAAQIGNKFGENENLRIAWGGATLSDLSTDEFKRKYYEFDFASSNMHATGKSRAFMRANNVNFNYDTFPIPTYNIKTQVGKILDLRNGIDLPTKQLLLGNTAKEDTQFADQGLDDIPAFYTTARPKLPVTLFYKDGDKDVPFNGKYNAYEFKNVPIKIHLKDISYTWIDPTKHDSFVPSDYFVHDHQKVNQIVGDAWKNMKNYVEGADGIPSIESYKFVLHNSRKLVINPGNEHWDTRISTSRAEEHDGNEFIALVTYVVNEYDSKEIVDEYKKHFTDISKPVPTELTAEELIKKNAVSISGVTTIFPSYFLSLYDDIFVPANKDEGNLGYVINEKKINKHLSDLLGILQRSSSQGVLPPSQLTTDSQNLLKFLAYMFADGEQVSISNSIKTEPFEE